VYLATNDVERNRSKARLVAKNSVFLQILGYALAKSLGGPTAGKNRIIVLHYGNPEILAPLSYHFEE